LEDGICKNGAKGVPYTDDVAAGAAGIIVGTRRINMRTKRKQ
jgi:hypothetical protein